MRMGSSRACLRKTFLSVGRCMCPTTSQLAFSTPSKSTYPVLMPILAAQHSFTSWVCIVVSGSRDIDEQSTRSINPSCIDNIQLIRLLPIHVMRIDLQHVISAFWYAWGLIVEDGHVVVGCKVVHRRFGYLDIGVRIPWQNLWLHCLVDVVGDETLVIPFDSTTNPTVCHA